MKYIYPTLLQVGNIIDSDSWFDIIMRKNKSYNKKKKKKEFNYDYVDTKKIKLDLLDNQKNILNNWFDDCIDIYNLTNEYIKNNIKKDNIKKILNFINLRKSLNENIREICKKNNLNKHTADYSVKHCVEMYKSSYSNHKNIDKFNIKNLDKNRRRKNIIIEPANVSKKNNSIFIKILKNIKSSIPLNNIKKNSILQYDSFKNTYIIISPYDKINKIKLERYDKCGIDIGVRTFMTTYSENASYEFGTNTNKIIDRINKRLDNINKSNNNNKLSKEKYNKLNYKYLDKLKNKINDLHNKCANFLLSQYETIIIGKISTKKMVSNLTGNLKDIVKRRLMALSHYKFRMKLKQMAKKFDSKIIETDEYLTSKTCSGCNKINDNLGSKKLFICEFCKLQIDRDINASINIYLNRTLTRSSPLKIVEKAL